MAKWSSTDIPSQAERVAVVTGANSGLGFVTARELARAGATVVLACRDANRGDDARQRLQSQLPRAAAGSSTISVAAHPGYAATSLQAVGQQLAGSRTSTYLMSVANRIFAQSDEQGALPTLYAATAPEVRGGDYIGPDGLLEQ